MTGDRRDAARRQARLAAVVIFLTFPAWMLASWLGGKAGLEPRFAFLFDFAALGAFLWAMIVLWRAWRAMRG
ncbi:MAG: hypothetical protein D6686_02245 [Alphaproteobacteria bacterium]|nr:MAG: hypothetical protein D6686_02245 [Alphaproteobacteria bacterium]